MKYNKQVYRSFVMIGQFGISILVPIGLCSVAGYYLDQYFGTSFLFVLFFFIGALAGFRNVYLFSRKIYETKEKDNYEAIRKEAVSSASNKTKDKKTKKKLL
jgi:F0F1-type ATP synthase assembly protein I